MRWPIRPEDNFNTALAIFNEAGKRRGWKRATCMNDDRRARLMRILWQHGGAGWRKAIDIATTIPDLENMSVDDLLGDGVVAKLLRFPIARSVIAARAEQRDAP